jgi:hypothetical protein
VVSCPAACSCRQPKHTGMNRPIQPVTPHLTFLPDRRMRHAANWWNIISARRWTEAFPGHVLLHRNLTCTCSTKVITPRAEVHTTTPSMGTMQPTTG